MRIAFAIFFSQIAQLLLPGARADTECYNNLTSLRRTGDLDELYAQHVLTRGKYMCNGIYRFGVDKEGTLVYGDVGRDEVIQKTGDKGSYLVMQHDGNLVFRDSQDITRWQTGTNDKVNTKISLYTDGSIKIKDDSGWEYEVPLRPDDWDNDDIKPDNIDCIGDTIYGRFNDALFPGDYICTGDHKFGVHKDSMDLVYLYRNDDPKHILSDSGSKAARSYLLMQQDGNCVFYGGDWKTRTFQEVESHAGILRITEKSGKAELSLVDMTTDSVKYSTVLSEVSVSSSLRKSTKVQEIS